MKKIIKKIDKSFDDLGKVVDDHKDAALFIIGGETSGTINSTILGSGEVLVNIIEASIEHNELLRHAMMTAMFNYIQEHPQIMDKDLMSFPMGEHDKTVN